MSEEERAVIEAAVEWAMWREACHYGPGGEQLKQAGRDLEKAVSDLHSQHDGRWKPPDSPPREDGWSDFLRHAGDAYRSEKAARKAIKGED